MRPPRAGETYVDHRRPFRAQVPEIGNVGFRASRSAGTWRMHVHDSYELHYVERGLLWIEMENARHVARTGDVFLTLPNETHGGPRGVMGPCVIHWVGLRLRPDDGGRFFGLSSDEMGAILGRLGNLPARIQPGSLRQRDAFKRLLALCERRGAPDAAVQARSAALELMVSFAFDEPAHQHSLIVREAIAWMEQHLNEPFDADTISSHLGWSRSRLKTLFREEVQMPPAEWHMERRILQASRMLEEPSAKVTQIAHDLGFSSSQYFATTFRRLTGLTPEVHRMLAHDPARARDLAEFVPLSPPLIVE
jgi:AraC family transcriptional regulator, L-rhamnose operon regulatory protein RhaS